MEIRVALLNQSVKISMQASENTNGSRPTHRRRPATRFSRSSNQFTGITG
jgi:hypothetical protein